MIDPGRPTDPTPPAAPPRGVGVRQDAAPGRDAPLRERRVDCSEGPLADPAPRGGRELEAPRGGRTRR
jgi:hypothetical protein